MREALILSICITLIISDTTYASLYQTFVKRTWSINAQTSIDSRMGMVDYGGRTGWVKENNKWYYLDSEGVAINTALRKDKTIYYFKPNGEWLEPGTIDYNNYRSLLEQLDFAINNKLEQYTLSIDGYDITDYASVLDSYMSMFMNDICSDPKILGISLSNDGISFSYEQQNKYLDSTEEVCLQVDNFVNEILSINGEEEQVKYINNKMIDIFDYDLTLSNKSNDFIRAFAADNKIVCIGYATIFKSLCDRIGIECKIIHGYTQYGFHAWNSVKINNEVKYIDVCWNDTGGQKDKFLLISKEEINRDHTETESFNIAY